MFAVIYSYLTASALINVYINIYIKSKKVIIIMIVISDSKLSLYLTLSDPGYFRQLTIRGGGL